MSFNFFVIGGDMRIFLLAKKIKNEGNKVNIYGFENINYENEGFNIIKSIEEIEKEISNNDIIISSIPFTMDGENIYAPYSKNKINIKDLINRGIINNKRKVIAGKIPPYIIGYDVLQDEALTIYNTIATAEGAISMAIIETNFNLSGANIMVLGFGRVGKTLCQKLKGFGANVYCEARKENDLAWIETMGCIPVPIEKLNENLCKMDVVFNTIPYLILDKTKLILMSKNTLIIDLASKPGGVDFESAEKLGINAILYGGIPGKISPDTSADYIKNFIYKKCYGKK